ncbi:MAG: Type II secretion system protein, partial [Candidatus Woesebacteria bacterium GW2011_GWF2_46_8]
MKRFTYKAKDKSGSVVTGEVEASSAQVAAKLVRARGLTVIAITPRRESLLTLIQKFRDRITLGDVATFTRQLATMVNAGLPITQALLILRSQSKGS